MSLYWATRKLIQKLLWEAPFPAGRFARSRYSAAAPGALTASASAIGGTAFVRATVFHGAPAGVDFLAALLRAARFSPGLAAAGVASSPQ